MYSELLADRAKRITPERIIEELEKMGWKPRPTGNPNHICYQPKLGDPVYISWTEGENEVNPLSLTLPIGKMAAYLKISNDEMVSMLEG